MKSAVLEKPAATGALDADRLRALVLVRIASAADIVEFACGIAQLLKGDFTDQVATERRPAAVVRLRK